MTSVGVRLSVKPKTIGWAIASLAIFVVASHALLPVAASEAPLPETRGSEEFSISFPAENLQDAAAAPELAKYLAGAIGDSSLDFTASSESDLVPALPEAFSYSAESALLPMWSKTITFGPPTGNGETQNSSVTASPPSHLTIFYRGSQFVFFSYDVPGSKITSASSESVIRTAEELAVRLDLPVGSTQNVTIPRTYVAGGSEVEEVDVMFFDQSHGWPLGYVNRFVVTTQVGDLHVVRVASTSWLSFSIGPVVSSAAAESSAISYSARVYSTQLDACQIETAATKYIAWSWDARTLVYIVWLFCLGPDDARELWVAVGISRGDAVLSELAPPMTSSARGTNYAWLLEVIIATTAATVAALLPELQRRLRHPPPDGMRSGTVRSLGLAAPNVDSRTKRSTRADPKRGDFS
jgi:hypothetical protein